MALSSRTRLNFVLDGVTLAALLLLIATGLAIEFRLPHGMGGGGRNAQALLGGLGRHEWGEVHFYLSMTFIALMLVHLFLHWRWVWAVARGGAVRGARVRGAGFLALTAGLLVIVALPWLLPLSVGTAPASQPATAPAAASDATSAAAPAPQSAPAAPANWSDSAEHPALPAAAEKSHGEGLRPDELRGSSTIDDAAEALGMPIKEIEKRLGLGPLAGGERLGRLAHQHHLEMHELRRRLGLPADVQH